jgi:hypothetical protein
MKYINYLIYLFWVYLFLPNKLMSQDLIFNGKLFYEFENNAPVPASFDSVFGERKMQLMKDYFHQANIVVLIKNNKLVDKHTTFKDDFVRGTYQSADTTYSIKTNGEKYSSKDMVLEGQNMLSYLNKIQFKEKTKDKKNILGFICTKYVYSLPSNTMLIAWIPDDLKFRTQYKYGNFFKFYFLPDGLGFEIEEIYKERFRKWRLKKIEIFDVTQKDFGEFLSLIKIESQK